MLCLWSDQSVSMALFMIFNLWICPGFIFESHSFLIFNSRVTVTTLVLELFSSVCRNKFTVCIVPSN
jgi:ABC-type multidrug transport system permease subunit